MKGQFTGLNVGTIKRIYIEPVTRRDWTLNEVSVMLFSVKDFVITQCKVPKKRPCVNICLSSSLGRLLIVGEGLFTGGMDVILQSLLSLSLGIFNF